MRAVLLPRPYIPWAKWAAAVDPIEHLDFDLVCESGRCGRTAVWILWRVRCCPDPPPHVLVCERCRTFIWRMRFGTCTYCQTQVFVPARSAFYRVEPINERNRGGS